MADPLDVVALAEVTIELGYERDAAGHLLGTRDPDPRDRREPSFHLVRTLAGNRWAVSAHLSAEERQELEAALGRAPVVSTLADLESTPPLVGAIEDRLYRGPAFVFPVRIQPPAHQVELAGDVSALRTIPQLDWVRDASPAAYPMCVARNEAGRVIAVCHSSRSLPSAAAAGAETAEAYRGRGLGTAVVAGWARAVRAQGRTPHYGTEWPNAASRGIARRLGLMMWGEEVHPA